MECIHAEPFPTFVRCRKGLHGGRPSMGVCQTCTEREVDHAQRRAQFYQAIETAKQQTYKPSTERGIVIVGGGKYFASAYVTIRVLRHVGCRLPIELWHLPGEMDAELFSITEEFDVRCIEGFAVGGWQLKSHAVLHSSFQEVLYLDADSYPVREPSYLFDEPDYLTRGAIFWPDKPSFDLKREIWETVGVAYRDEPDFESGQFVVNKAKWHQALWLADWMNQRSDYYYSLFWGDKSTFHLAARAMGLDYAMPSLRWQESAGTMVQHDLDGKPLFNHRTRDKFTLALKGGFSEFWTTKQKCDIAIFNRELELETEAHGFLAELAKHIGGKPLAGSMVMGTSVRRETASLSTM